jgi:hypothetical protein
MTHYKTIAAALLLVTGALHVYQWFLSPPTRVTVGVTLFGVLYLALGLWCASGSRRALVVGRVLPVVGALAAISTVFRDGNPLLPWTVLFIAIDVGIVWACVNSLRGR